MTTEQLEAVRDEEASQAADLARLAEEVQDPQYLRALYGAMGWEVLDVEDLASLGMEGGVPGLVARQLALRSQVRALAEDLARWRGHASRMLGRGGAS